MSAKKEIWRLLEPMDAGEDGDQWSSDGLIWRDIDKNTPLLTIKFRRRLVTLPEPQGWISVKERMPTKEDGNKQGMVLWIDSELSVGVGSWDIHERGWQSHWTAIPDDPEPERDADEEAWKEYERRENEDCRWSSDEWTLCKKLFLAGRRSAQSTQGGES